MNQNRRTAAITWGLAAGLSLTAAPAFAELVWNMPRGVTDYSHAVYDLHMLALWICTAIGVLVFGAIFYSIVRHRKSNGNKASQFHHNTLVEIIWTAIPFLILVSMAVPATQVLIDIEDTSGSEMTVKITGYQWMWGYEYMGEGVQFYSTLADASNRARRLDSGIDPATVEHYLLDVDKPLVLPTDTRIRFLITGADVIHSWWVPALGWKKDAIPGYINAIWTEIEVPGVYRGQCAELCGRDHAFMPVVVKAVPPEEFQQWLAEQKQNNGDTGAQAARSAQDAAGMLATR